MTLKPHLLIGLVLLAAGVPVQAQVIEIDSAGNAQTFDRPAVFSIEGAAPIGRTSASAATPTAFDVDRTIAEASRLHGIDRGLLEAVAWQESRGRMTALSPKGAAGIMQLMPATAAELGVRIDDVADNIRGGAMYLRRQIDRFGSVPLALAAYNAGPGAVARYSGIPPYRETRDYVTRIMARWRPAASRISVRPTLIAANPNVIEVPTL